MTKCSNKGATHIERARQTGYRVKIGKQRCRDCGAEIVVIERPKGWAFTPVHDKPNH